MEDILLTPLLRARGLDGHEVLRLVRSGDLERVRRGAYVESAERRENETTEAAHRRLVLATAPQLEPGAVLSHGSAAVLHGLPVWPGALQRVHVTRSRSYGARKRNLVEVHSATVPDAHLSVVDGIVVTSAGRTVADLGRTRPFAEAVAAADRALALGLDRQELEQVLVSMLGWPYARRARRVLDFADGRSESVGESVSRVRLHERGLPAPDLRQGIYDGRGRLAGRVDFCWAEQRTIGEFDGRIKYGRLLKPGQRVEDVLHAEKAREDALRDLGWSIVRWLWADLSRPEVIEERLLRAFARAR